MLTRLKSTASQLAARSISLPRWAIVGIGAILAAGGLLAFNFEVQSVHREEVALDHYKTNSQQEALLASGRIASDLTQIYQNIRTISMLRSVMNIARHGENIDENARMSNNNLASNVAVSEVYIVPVDLNPDEIDPETKKPEIPILMFDELITSQHEEQKAGTAQADEAEKDAPEEVEIYEYRELHRQMAWLKQRYPTSRTFEKLKVPFISSQELITCDNSVFNKTRLGADREGMVMSVPFYGADGVLKGTISAIIRTKAIEALLPNRDYALVNASTGFVASATDGGQQVSSMEQVRQARPDPTLLFSSVVPVSISGQASDWRVWSGSPNSSFFLSPEISSIRSQALLGYLISGCLSVLGVAFVIGFWLRQQSEAVENERKLAGLRNAALENERAQREQEAQRLEVRTLEEAQRKREAEAKDKAEQDRRASEEARRVAEAEAIRREREIVAGSIGAALSKLAQKDLTYRMTQDIPEAYRQLGVDFNSAMGELVKALEGVTKHTHAIELGTKEISSAADELARRTENQAASLEESAAALSSITETVQSAAKSAKHAREVVAVAMNDVTHGSEVVQKTIELMGHIEKSSRQIEQIIGVIDEITFQTNLLALNACVEAARAGEAGRGFAVVASEVRALAQRSAEAAKEIKGLISSSATDVSQGVTLVAETGKSLERILAQVSEINKVVGDIAAASAEQATGIEQVNQAVREMDQVTQQNASMAEETNAGGQNSRNRIRAPRGTRASIPAQQQCRLTRFR